MSGSAEKIVSSQAKREDSLRLHDLQLSQQTIKEQFNSRNELTQYATQIVSDEDTDRARISSLDQIAAGSEMIPSNIQIASQNVQQV